MYVTFICLVIGDRERGIMAEGDWSVDLWCPCMEGGGVLRSGGDEVYEGISDLFVVVGGVLVAVVGVLSTSVSYIGVRGSEGSEAGGLLRSRYEG